jgi:TRAP-type transport system periplasmic protein
MKRRYILSWFTILVLILFLAPSFLTTAIAGDKKEIIFAMAAPYHPESGGETPGIAIYLEALQGRLQNHPDLKGKFKLKVVDKGLLVGSQEEALSALRTGGIQMTYSNPRFLEQVAPEWKLLSVPGMLSGWDHLERAMQTKPWAELHESTAKQKNVRIIKWCFNIADLLIFTDIGPVKTMEDLKGQKIRFPGGEAYSRLLKALGTTGIALPYTEVVTALQTHMVDGVITEISGALEYYDLPRYTKYAINYPLGMDTINWVVNNKWWESLEPKERKAINDVFQRIDLSKFFILHMKKLMKVWAENPKLEMLELSEKEQQIWAKAIRSAGLDLVSGIDPKYLNAIDATR